MQKNKLVPVLFGLAVVAVNAQQPAPQLSTSAASTATPSPLTSPPIAATTTLPASLTPKATIPVIPKSLDETDREAVEVARLTGALKLLEVQESVEKKRADLERFRLLTGNQTKIGLPIVTSIEGIDRNLIARLVFVGGSSLHVRTGDRLPSGQWVVGITPSKVVIREGGRETTLPMMLASSSTGGTSGGSPDASFARAAEYPVPVDSAGPIQGRSSNAVPRTTAGPQTSAPIPTTR